MVVENNEQKPVNPDETPEEERRPEEEAQREEDSREAEVEQIEKEKYDELEDRYIRLQADYSNFRRRSTEQSVRLREMGMEKLALDILPVLDNFERALETEDVGDEKFYEGMAMIADQFRKELEKNEIVEIDALHALFDPNLHHAVMLEEKEGVEPDVVVEVLQKGYTLKERVIRPAMVKVSK